MVAQFTSSLQDGITCRGSVVLLTRNMYRTLVPLLTLAAAASGELSLCKRHVYLARAEQADGQGRKCWDHVRVPTCGGRCDSREVSDWQFPFKKAHHPVCVHGSRRALVVKLRHCDAGVAADTDVFRYVAAEDCRCMTCSSEHTSCEWLPPHSSIVEGIVDDMEDGQI